MHVSKSFPAGANWTWPNQGVWCEANTQCKSCSNNELISTDQQDHYFCCAVGFCAKWCTEDWEAATSKGVAVPFIMGMCAVGARLPSTRAAHSARAWSQQRCGLWAARTRTLFHPPRMGFKRIKCSIYAWSYGGILRTYALASGQRYQISLVILAWQCVFWLAEHAKKCDKIWYLRPLPNMHIQMLTLVLLIHT